MPLPYPQTIYTARNTGVTASQTTASNITPALDGTFIACATVRVTTSSAENFTVTMNSQDDGGNGYVGTFNFQLKAAGTPFSAINFANGATVYEGIPIMVRLKGGVTVTFVTVGTFTGCTYNWDVLLMQVA